MGPFGNFLAGLVSFSNCRGQAVSWYFCELCVTVYVDTPWDPVTWEVQNALYPNLLIRLHYVCQCELSDSFADVQ